MKTNIITLNSYCDITNAVTEDNFLKIEGYAAHYNKPNFNSEIVNADSFNMFFNMYKSKELEPVVNYEHSDTVLGDVTEIVSKKDGLWISARLNNDVKIVNEMLAPNILAGTLKKFSTEGIIYGGLDGIVVNKDNTYYVKNFLLTAVSIVRTPADPNAAFSVKNYIEELKRKQSKPIIHLI